MGQFAHGATLRRGDGGSPEVFTAIAGVTSVGGPSFAADTIDVTDHDSTNSFREFIAGLRDSGEISFEGNWMPRNATQDWNTGANFLADFRNGTLRNFRMTIPDSSGALTWHFAAIVTAFEGALPHDAGRTFSATLKVSGEVTEA